MQMSTRNLSQRRRIRQLERERIELRAELAGDYSHCPRVTNFVWDFSTTNWDYKPTDEELYEASPEADDERARQRIAQIDAELASRRAARRALRTFVPRAVARARSRAPRRVGRVTVQRVGASGADPPSSNDGDPEPPPPARVCASRDRAALPEQITSPRRRALFVEIDPAIGVSP
jgi:hypothetical protein